MSSPDSGTEPVKARLGLWDAISVIVGIVIGATIFETAPSIFHDTGSPWIALGLWALGGFLAFIGALCYAELATTYPRLGGDYNYLTRAYGPVVGYAFGWAQLAVVQTASIGMMAYIFASYTVRLTAKTAWWDVQPIVLFEQLTLSPELLYAVGAVVVITLLNLLGVILGKLAQNLLSLVKLLGLLAIVVVGFVFAAPTRADDPEMFSGVVTAKTDRQLTVREADGSKVRSFVVSDKTPISINRKNQSDEGEKHTLAQVEVGAPVNVYFTKGAAETDPVLRVKVLPPPLASLEFWGALGALAATMVQIMLGYGGWNDAAFVAAEVRDRQRNLPRALMWGTLLVTVLYVLVNAAYIFGLGFDRASDAQHIAADVLGLAPGEVGRYAEVGMCLLVMVSALGAVNGLVYTSSRIYSTLGSDYSLFAPLGKWSRVLGTPVWSLLVQMLITVGIMVLVGTQQGKNLLNQGLDWLGQAPVAVWGSNGFLPLLAISAPIFWIFFLLTGLSLFVLRINDPHIERPFRVPLYPLVPLLFCATCGYLLYSGIGFANLFGVAAIGAGLMLLGVPFYIFSRRRDAAPPEPAAQPPAPALAPRGRDW